MSGSNRKYIPRADITSDGYANMAVSLCREKPLSIMALSGSWAISELYNSLGMAMSTYAGQNIGANKIGRVKQGCIKACMIMTIFSLAMLPIALFCGESIMKLFVDNPEVIAYGVTALKITSCFYIFLGIIYVIRSLLNGVGDAGFALLNGVIELISRIVLARPLTLIPIIGVWGIWWATVLTWMSSSISCIWRYKLEKWNHTKNLG